MNDTGSGTPSRPAAGLVRHILGRLAGLGFVANVAFLAGALVLLAFTVESARSRGGPALSARTAVLIVLALGLLALVLRGGRGINLAAALVMGGILAAGQAWLHPRRVAEYPASSTRHPTPYVMFTGLPGVDDHNTLGYRGREPARPKPAAEHRILMVGGSAVYGKGQPELTIPFQLQWLSTSIRRPEPVAPSSMRFSCTCRIAGFWPARAILRAPFLPRMEQIHLCRLSNDSGPKCPQLNIPGRRQGAI